MEAVHHRHHELVRSQYSQEEGARFYRTVMGAGTGSWHYGLYDSADTSMEGAAAAATDALHGLAGDDAGPRWLDLGAGEGWSARRLAARCAAASSFSVTCVDLCAHLHEANRKAARKEGVADRIVTWTGSFEALPGDWSEAFDLVWSQDSICHARDKAQVFQEAFRVLKPGGTLVFSDITLAENAEPERAAAFTGVNAVAKLATGTEYCEWMASAGFTRLVTTDWSVHLPRNFARMLAQLREHRPDLLTAGVDAGRINRFEQALVERLGWAAGSVLRWGAFRTQKPAPAREAGQSEALLQELPMQ